MNERVNEIYNFFSYMVILKEKSGFILIYILLSIMLGINKFLIFFEELFILIFL